MNTNSPSDYVDLEIFGKLLRELWEVPPEILPPDEREDAAYAWALGAQQKGYTKIDEILNDRGLKALVLDDFDDEAADARLALAMATFESGARETPAVHAPSLKVGRNDPCPCGSGKKYKKCCLV